MKFFKEEEESDMRSKWKKFKLLMWKNYLLQIRNPYTTAFEIIIPLLFTLLLVIIRSLVQPEIFNEGLTYAPIKLTKPINIDPDVTFTGAMRINSSIPMKEIVYFPKTPHIDDLMEKTKFALKWGNNFVGISSINEFERRVKNSSFAGIEFPPNYKNLASLPNQLKYNLIFPGELVTMRYKMNPMHYNWWTNRKFPKFATASRNHNHKVDGVPSGYYQEGFLNIEHAIFEGFLQIKNHLNFNLAEIPKIEIQRFPVPKFIVDAINEGLQDFLAIFILLCFVYPCINIIKYITMEKEKQLKEAMKIMGLDSWLHWTAWFAKCFVYMIITVTLITILCTVGWYGKNNPTAVFTNSSPSVIWVFLLIYSITTITFCFMLSVFFSKASNASAVGGFLWFITYTPYFFIKNRYEFIPLRSKLLLCLLSNTGMSLGFNVVMRYEGTNEGVQWSNVFNPLDADDSFNLGYVWMMLLVDALIYLSIALYIERIFPGDFGVAEKWNFLFKKSFWMKAELHEINHVELEDLMEKNEIHKKVGIKIVNLRKMYQDKIAVDGLNLNICENEITVLLGHNGAGKSTTMSILTGMICPTSGTAIINGRDIRKDMNLVRSSIGFCPQHDILFDNLTVSDHITFYSLLKGMTNYEARKEVKKFVNLLKLGKKINAKSKSLSGGMKRKLSVAIALCGNSKIVFFDEPSSGVDPGARRDLLELIQKEKKGRTILLSTHFMQDAEVLGDQIAIMANGQLKASGSSFSLKKTYGEGYRLVCVKENASTRSDDVTNLLRKYIPDIQKESEIGTELTYCMNEKNVLVFQNMLQDLEENADELNIDSYGVSLTTLEEVFMKIGADNNHEIKSSTIDLSEGFENELIQEENFYEYGDSLELLFGFRLFFNQFYAMMQKKILTSKRSLVLHLIQFLIPIVFISITILIVRTWETMDLPPLELSLKTHPNTITILKCDKNLTKDSFEFKIAENYFNQLKPENVERIYGNLTSYYLDKSKESPIRVNTKYLYGATFEKSRILMHFNNRPLHTTPISLGLIHNAILKAVTDIEDIGITITNKPLPYSSETKIIMTGASNNLGFQLSFNLGFAMSFVASFFVIHYVKEQKSKAKHLQFVSGINPFTYWLTAFLWDFLTFMFISLLVILTFTCFQEKGFRTYEELSRVFSVLLLFGFAFLPTVYVSTFIFETPAGGFIKLSIAFMFFGAAMHLMVFALRFPSFNLIKLADTLTEFLLSIPHYSLCHALNNINVMNVNKEVCDIQCERYGKCNRGTNCDIDSDPCCNTNFFSWKSPGISKNAFFFILSGISSFCLLFLIEFRIFEVLFYNLRHKILIKLLPKFFKSPPSLINENNGDNDVLNEKDKINNMGMSEYADYSLIMKNVTRYYKDFLAVNQLSIGIKAGEAFGLLGVNGAGKTSTFKMLTGDIKISKGEAFVDGISLNTNMKEVHKITGYCPQFDALIDNLTGRETLRFFAMSRGIPKHKLSDVIQKLAEDFNFTKHLDKRVKAFSGGNKRKLSTAVALLGNNSIIYLDEPTTGMDIKSKRNLWDVICKVRNAGKTIILTSHSMEECEALCTRLVIMVNGQFKCLGSIQHLKSKYGQGFDLVVKLKRKTENIQIVRNKKKEIKKFINEEFPGASLKEEYYDLMAFRVPSKNLKWSEIFGKLQEAKTRLDIEDYSIAQASLEQIFLSFTMYQRDGNN